MKKKVNRKVFKLRELMSVIDRNGRVWNVIKFNVKGVVLSAMEDDPLPNAIVVSSTHFYDRFKEYIVIVKPKRKGNISWEDKKGEGSYFDPKLNRMTIRPYDNIDKPIRPKKSKTILSDDDVNFSDFQYRDKP